MSDASNEEPVAQPSQVIMTGQEIAAIFNKLSERAGSPVRVDMKMSLDEAFFRTFLWLQNVEMRDRVLAEAAGKPAPTVMIESKLFRKGK